jgi:hypothetical protein
MWGWATLKGEAVSRWVQRALRGPMDHTSGRRSLAWLCSWVGPELVAQGPKCQGEDCTQEREGAGGKGQRWPEQCMSK